MHVREISIVRHDRGSGSNRTGSGSIREGKGSGREYLGGVSEGGGVEGGI